MVAPMPHTLLTALALLLIVVVQPITAQRGDRWPSFRGPSASGVADDVRLPDRWNVKDGSNVLWTVTVPGLAHSSPIVWGDRVFVTTAVSSRGGATFKPGLYGEGHGVRGSLGAALGGDGASIAAPARPVWQSTAYEGVPREKRHIKATYANATPATDGRYVVAFFGSQGLYAFDMRGKLLWKKDLGVLNTGAYDLPEYEWGTASSPIIYKDLVIVQCDTQNESFVLAADIDTGDTVWKTVRERTAVVGDADGVSGPGRTARRADHQRVELHPWLRSGHRRRTLAAGRQLEDHRTDAGLHPRRHRRRQRPRAGTSDLRDPARARPATSRCAPATSSNAQVLWSKTGRGSYMPTPLIYDGVLYVLANQGLLDAYDLR